MVIRMNGNKKIKLKKIVIVGVVVFAVYLLLHHMTKPSAPTIPLPTVVVQTPKLMKMTDYITETGVTVAFNSVNLVARVSGYLESIGFTDGSIVKKDTELFVIQPEPYWQQLQSARASVVAEKAAYAYDQSEYARQKRMYKDNATSLNNVEKWASKVQESGAQLDKGKANEINAEINYSYTHVKAPFDGRIGRHLVDVGNLVGNGVATNLATIEQIDKLYVYFNVNELDLLRLRAAARAAGFKPKEISKIPVYVNMQNETGFKHKATFDFINTGLNASTGTMELRAVLDNKDYLFVPGLFVQVRVAVSQPKEQLTVPDSAVLYDQIGSYLFLIDKDNTVVLQRVALGGVEKGQRAITKGLDGTSRVIVNGIQNASPGKKVALQASNKQ